LNIWGCVHKKKAHQNRKKKITSSGKKVDKTTGITVRWQRDNAKSTSPVWRRGMTQSLNPLGRRKVQSRVWATQSPTHWKKKSEGQLTWKLATGWQDKKKWLVRLIFGSKYLFLILIIVPCQQIPFLLALTWLLWSRLGLCVGRGSRLGLCVGRALDLDFASVHLFLYLSGLTLFGVLPLYYYGPSFLLFSKAPHAIAYTSDRLLACGSHLYVSPRPV